MKRLLCLLTIASLSLGARAAPTTEALEDALNTIRGRVVFVDPSDEARTVRIGRGFEVFGAIGLAIIAINIGGWGVPAFSRPELAALGAAVAVIGVGGGITAVGQYRLKQRPARPLESLDHYKSVGGLNDFMGLTAAQQFELAHGNPEFGEFLVRLSDAYKMTVQYDVAGAK